MKDNIGRTQLSSAGDYARISSSSDYAQISSAGNYTQIGSVGDYAQISSAGDNATINSVGKYSVVCCAGSNSIAKGKVGSWLTLSEWKYSEEEDCLIPICVKTKKIDGVEVKEDIYYQLTGGEFVEF